MMQMAPGHLGIPSMGLDHKTEKSEKPRGRHNTLGTLGKSNKSGSYRDDKSGSRTRPRRTSYVSGSSIKVSEYTGFASEDYSFDGVLPDEEPTGLNDHLENAAELEKRLNENDFRRLFGTPITYGQVIQFQHVRSLKYCTIQPTLHAHENTSNIRLSLQEGGNENSWFIVMPRFKLRSEGERVQVGDQILIVSAKSGRLFINATLDNSEVSASIVSTSWKVELFLSFDEFDSESLKSGDTVRFLHRENEKFLIYHKSTVSLSDKEKQTLEMVDSNANWTIEVVDEELSKWRSGIRFKHMCQDLFLALKWNTESQEYEPFLSPDRNRKDTTFALYSTNVDEKEFVIGMPASCRILHVSSGKWISAHEDKIVFTDVPKDEHSFLLEKVANDQITDIEYVLEVKQALQNFTRNFRTNEKVEIDIPEIRISVPGEKSVLFSKRKEEIFSRAQGNKIIQILSDLVFFVAPSSNPDPFESEGIPVLSRQKIIREQKLIDDMFNLVKIPFVENGGTFAHISDMDKPKSIQQKQFAAIGRLIYKIIRHLIISYRQNELYVSKWLSLMQSQIEISTFYAANTISTLLSDNFELIEKFVTVNEVDRFIQIIHKNREPRYVHFLTALASCQGMPIVSMQELITDRLFDPNNKSFLLDINFGKGEKSWKNLSVKYYDLNTKKWNTSEFRKFCSEQVGLLNFYIALLTLFAELCLGRQYNAIEKIKQILPFKIVMCCLESRLPYNLRAKFCGILLTAYIDTEGCEEVMSIKYARLWNRSDERARVTRMLPYLDEVKNFVTTYLDQIGTVQIVERKDKNYFTFHVMELTRMLITFGLFNAKELEGLQKHLIDVLDGRSDEMSVEAYEQTMKLKRYKDRKAQLPDSEQRKVVAENTLPIMQTKLKTMQILLYIHELDTDKHLSKILDLYRNLWKEATQKKTNIFSLLTMPKQRTDILKAFEQCFAEVDDHIKIAPILLDMLQYKYSPTQMVAAKLLVSNFRRRCEVVAALNKVQLLVSLESIEVYFKVIKLLSRFRNDVETSELWLEKTNPKELQLIKSTLELFRDFCIHEKFNGANDNQELLRNLCVPESIFELLKLQYDHYHLVLKDTFEIAFEFFSYFSKGNKKNQHHLFSHLDTFLSYMHKDIDCLDCFSSILSNNRTLCLQVSENLIRQLTSLIRGFDVRFLKLFEDIVKVESSVIKSNQNVVIRCLLETPGVVLLFDTNSGLETRKLLYQHKPEDPRLKYHEDLIQLLNLCCERENSYAIQKCQDIIVDPLLYLTRTIVDEVLPESLRIECLIFLNRVFILVEESGDCRYPGILGNRFLWELICYFNENIMKLDYLEHILAFISGYFSFCFNCEEKFTFKEKNIITELAHRIVQFSTNSNEKLRILSGDCIRQLGSTAGALIHDKRLVGKMNLIVAGIDVVEPNTESRHVVEKIDAWDGTQPIPKEEEPRTVCVLEGFNAFREVVTSITNEIREAEFGILVEICRNPSLLVTSTSERGVVDFIKNCTGLIGLADTLAQGGLHNEILCHVLELLKRLSRKRTNSFFIDLMAVRSKQENITSTVSDAVSAVVTGAYKGIVGTGWSQQEVISRFIVNELTLLLGSHFRIGPVDVGEVQIALANAGCCRLVVSNCVECTDYDVVRSSLNLGISLLTGGNADVQEVFFQIFKEDSSIFLNIRQRIRQAIQDVIFYHQQLADLTDVRSTDGYVDVKNHNVLQLVSTTCIDEVFIFLQNLCEGHNLSIQNYLRSQVFSNRGQSFDLIKETSNYLAQILTGNLEDFIDDETVDNIILCLKLLTEFCQGPCLENQNTVASTKVVDICNLLILSEELQPICSTSYEKFLDLKMDACILLLSLLEGGNDVTGRILTSLDTFALLTNLNSIYEKLSTTDDGAIRFKLEGVGHYIYILCMSFKAHDPMLNRVIARTRTKKKFLLTNQETENRAVVKQNIKVEEQDSQFDEATKNFSRITDSVEIVFNDDIVKVFFHLYPMCRCLTNLSKKRFIWEVKRDSPSEKIQDFFRRSDDLIKEMEWQEKLRINKRLSWFAMRNHIWKNLSLILAILINILILIYFVAPETSIATDEDHLPRVYTSEVSVSLWISILGGCQTFTSTAILVFYNINFGKLLVDKGWLSLFSDPLFLYYSCYVIVTLLGNFISPFFYCLHLFDIILREETLKNVVRSLTYNGRSLLMTGLLGAVILYVFSIIGFLFLRKDFLVDTQGGDQYSCDTMLTCMATVVNVGLTMGGGVSEGVGVRPFSSKNYPFRLVYDLMFFFICIIILLNIIFGIIIDTFSELRQKKTEKEHDRENVCFICGLTRYTLDRDGSGFDRHVNREHNIWSYLNFLVYLKKKDRTEYNGVEQYVADHAAVGDLSFIPQLNALCLEDNEFIHDDHNQMIKMKQDLEYLISVIKDSKNVINSSSSGLELNRSNGDLKNL